MKVMIVAGGTGGHFYPGLSVAKEILAYGGKVKFIVRENDFVIPLLRREGIPFVTMAAAGLKRRLALSNLFFIPTLVLGFVHAFLRLASFRPDVVLVMGGYLSFAPSVAARFLKIPVVLHEQNVVPGLANKLISQFANRIALSFDESRDSFGENVIVTGNPVRPEFGQLPDANEARMHWGLDPDKKTILIFGGSLGAHRINELVVSALKEMTNKADSLQILHFTGQKDEPSIRQNYEQLPFRYHVAAYCHEMPKAYAACNVVVCRSGASTVSELIVVKKPALLIPYPHATNNHQLANARVLENLNMAVVKEEFDLTPDVVMHVLFGFLGKGESRVQEVNQVKWPEDPLVAAKKIAVLVESQTLKVT